MPARLRLADHCSAEELWVRYRNAKQPTERTHFQVLHLLGQRWRTEDIAEAVGYSVVWIRLLAKRYNEGGAEAMGDRRRHNAGQVRLLDGEAETALQEALKQKPAEGGLWSGPQVAAWMSTRLARPVHPRAAAGKCCAGWAIRRSGPGPRTKGAIGMPRRAFQQNLPVTLADEQQAHPEERVELWSSDEHRVGLQPILRGVWAPQGERPVAVVRPRYEWLYVVAFVHPEDGATSFWLVPAINAAIFSALLHAFAALSPDSRDTQREAGRVCSARYSRGDFIPSAECGAPSL